MKNLFSLFLLSFLLLIQVNGFSQMSDDCADAIPITCDAEIIGSTIGMTVDDVDCGQTNSAPGVWYQFTGEGDIAVSTCGGTDFDSKISVFGSTDGTCESMVCLAYNDDFCGLQSNVNFYANEIATYFILVHGFGTNSGIFTLSVTCTDDGVLGCTDPLASNYNPNAQVNDGSCQYDGPSNDNCDAATPILNGELLLVNNVNATADMNFWGECWGFGNGEAEQTSVWYSFTTPDVPSNINLTSIADNSGTLTDTQFALFDSCNGNVVACDGNSAGGLMAGFYFGCNDLETSTTYYLMIDGWNSDSGTCYLALETYECGPVAGCTDPEALNYNPEATEDDGTCEYSEPCFDNVVTVSIDMDSFGNEASWTIFNSDNEPVANNSPLTSNAINLQDVCLVDGCYYMEMYDTFGDGWGFGNGSGLVLVSTPSGEYQYTFATGNFASLAFGVNEDGCEVTVFGCTDEEALNFNPNANEDDGSCEYPFECDDVLATLYVCTFSNGNEVGLEILDEDSNVVYSNFNYNNGELMYTEICLEEGVCYSVNMYNTVNAGWYGGYYWIDINGVQVSTGSPADDQNFASTTFSTNGPCGDFFPGCTDMQACNYDSLANYDDQSCTYPGCMDIEAYNYNPFAGCNDEELCIYLDPVENDLCGDAIAIACGDNVSGLTIGATVDNVGTCGTSNTSPGVWYVLEGDNSEVTLSTCGQADYDTKISVFASFEDCSTLDCVTGNDDACSLQSSVTFGASTGVTYYVLVHGFGSGTGTFTLSVECGEENMYGCMDASACNYDSTADTDDGSCTYPGCLDDTAINFEPNAGCEDDSCVYQEDCDANSVIAVLMTDQYAWEMSWEIVNENDEIVMEGNGQGNDQISEPIVSFGCLEDGCYTLNMYDSFGDGWNVGADGGIFITINETQLIAGTIDSEFGTVEFGINSDCEGEEDFFGCTDSTALNYNSLATIDDGSCIYFELPPCVAEFAIVEIDTESNNIIIVNLSDGENLDFFWDFGDGNTSTDAFPVHQYAEDGTYTVCLTVSNFDEDCVATFCADITYEAPGLIIEGSENEFGTESEGFSINVISLETVSVEEEQNEIIYNLYPNPAQYTITLTGSSTENTLVNIYDLTGKEVYSATANDNNKEINVSRFSNGIYIMKIQDSTGIVTKRFEVMK